MPGPPLVKATAVLPLLTIAELIVNGAALFPCTTATSPSELVLVVPEEDVREPPLMPRPLLPTLGVTRMPPLASVRVLAPPSARLPAAGVLKRRLLTVVEVCGPKAPLVTSTLLPGAV